MGRPKKHWWGYVKSMIRRYPSRVNADEKRAVDRAIEITKNRRNGEDILKMIDMVFFRKSHTLDGAAQNLNYSYDTVKRWHTEFINTVGANFQCEKLH